MSEDIKKAKSIKKKPVKKKVEKPEKVLSAFDRKTDDYDREIQYI